MKEIIISGIGAYLPSRTITNKDLSAIVDTSNEWIVERTGIKERRISEGEDTSVIATKAAKEALKNAGLSPENIELIILATITPDTFTPSVACMVQKNLKATNAVAFDINAACSGFLFAMQVAESMMKSIGYKHALVIGAETLSKIIDWTDRSTCVLFGDAGGAAVLSLSESEGIIKSFAMTDGSKGDCLTIGATDVENPYSKNFEIKNKKLEMNGKEVFRFATSIMQESIYKVIEESGISLEDVKYIVPHQANLRIIDFAAKKLGVDKEKFYVNLDKFGNTSSASIPIALDEMNKKEMLKDGDIIVLVGFGGGLSYASTLIRWNKLK